MLFSFISISRTIISKISAKCLSFGGEMLERDDKKKHCYTIKRVSSSNYAYQDAKRFCEDIGGILPEVRGPKDYSNILGVITHTVRDDTLFHSKKRWKTNNFGD